MKSSSADNTDIKEMKMNLIAASAQVLRESRKGLHAREIADQILAKGLWQTRGNPPGASVGARLYMDIKKNGHSSQFVQVGPQTFALRAKPKGRAKKSAAPPTTAIADSQREPALNLGFSFSDCAKRVLENFGAKKPMHYREITERALLEGWLSTASKTPEATMYAQIITEIKRQQKRGERPVFVQHGKGFVGLSQWMGHGLTFQIEQYNMEIRKALHKKLLEMNPTQFEELVSHLLAEMGFEMVEVTKQNGDGGIDVRGTLVVGDVVRIKMAVQAKKWNPRKNIGAPVVQQVRGSLGAHEQGLIITTSDFSQGAVKEAAQPDKTPIALMNGAQLVRLLMQYGIGVNRSTPDLFELNADFGESSIGAE